MGKKHKRSHSQTENENGVINGEKEAHDSKSKSKEQQTINKEEPEVTDDNDLKEDEMQEEEEEEKEEEASDETQNAEDNSKDATFRDYFVDLVTTSFGDELDALRADEKNFDGKKLRMMVDAIEYGINLFSPIEQQLVISSLSNKANKTKQTPLKKHKQQTAS